MDLIFQFAFNLLMLSGIILIVSWIDKVQRSVIISLAIFNVVIFILSTIFSNHEMSLGSGLGMFALFTLMRYRSEPIKITEMSYILVVVCLGILNAIYPGILTFLQIVILEASILIIMIVLLKVMKVEKPSYKVKYEKMELLKPEKYSQLKSDLQNRLSREILAIEIELVNFHEQYANLKITFAGDDFEAKDNNIRPITEQLQKVG